MSDTPPDWVLIKATEECGWAVIPDELHKNYHTIGSFRALCNRILKDEQPPVDRKLLCAREAMAGTVLFDPVAIEGIVSRAIKLWEEGFGND